MRLRFTIFWGLLTAAGCGDDGSSGGSPAMGGADAGGTLATATGGNLSQQSSGGKSSQPSGGAPAGTIGGGVATGGTTTTQTNGGSGTVGGTTAGTLIAGNPCTSNCPTGTIDLCFSVGCPKGPCDNSRLHSGTLCSTLYPAPVDANTVYCAQGQNGSYCMATVDRILTYAVVTCTNGTPSIERCDAGCGVSENGVASC